MEGSHKCLWSDDVHICDVITNVLDSTDLNWIIHWTHNCHNVPNTHSTIWSKQVTTKENRTDSRGEEIHSPSLEEDLQGHRTKESEYREDYWVVFVNNLHRSKPRNQLIHFPFFVDNGLLNKAQSYLLVYLKQSMEDYILKDFLLNSHSWINYIQKVGVNWPWSKAKNRLHNQKSQKKQVRFQKHWLQNLNYLNQKPNADDQISSWQYLIWSRGSHLLFYS